MVVDLPARAKTLDRTEPADCAGPAQDLLQQGQSHRVPEGRERSGPLGPVRFQDSFLKVYSLWTAGCGFQRGDALFQRSQPVIHSFFHTVDST